jgi:2-methylcitrate dehydratase PrpD
LFAALADASDDTLHFERLTADLGREWELRRSSIKPYPCAQVIQPFVDLALAARAEGLRSRDVASITAPIAAQYIGVVAEPRAAKLKPATPTHARVSMQYCIAAAIHLGHCAPAAFTDEMIGNAEILRLADRVEVPPDPSHAAPGQLRASLAIKTDAGRTLSLVQEHHRGSVENPISRNDVEAKFEANTVCVLSPERQRKLRSMIDDITELRSIVQLVNSCVCARSE